MIKNSTNNFTKITLAILVVIVTAQTYVIWDLRKQVNKQQRAAKRVNQGLFPRSFKPWIDNWMFRQDDDSLFSSMANPFSGGEHPTMTISRNRSEVVVHVTLPTEDRDNLKIEVKDGVLRVLFQYNNGPSQQRSFDQSISLPSGLDITKMRTVTTKEGMDIVFPRK